MKISVLKAIWPRTIPVLTGYVFLGAAYGILMRAAGWPAAVPIAMSLIVFSGAIQFIAIPMLAAPFDPFGAFMVSLLVGARHIFYGIGMLDRYRGMGAKKLFLAHTLTDETFSILCSSEPPAGVGHADYFVAISALDFSYWVIGTAIGAAAGELASGGIRGLDFALTALFVVIFTEQFITESDHTASLIGAGSAALCLVIFGPGTFVVWSMLLIVSGLSLVRGRLEGAAR